MASGHGLVRDGQMARLRSEKLVQSDHGASRRGIASPRAPAKLLNPSSSARDAPLKSPALLNGSLIDKSTSLPVHSSSPNVGFDGSSQAGQRRKATIRHHRSRSSDG